MKYDLDLTTRNFSSRTKNKKQFIMLHHTWSTNFANTTRYLANAKNVSAHYTIWLNWEVGRIWNDNYVLWHSWKWIFPWIPRNFWNSYSIWIEVVSNWKYFTKIQIDKLEELLVELMEKYSIPKANIIRHKDYAPRRKWDIWDNFYKIAGYSSFEDWRLLFNNKVTPRKEAKIGMYEKLLWEKLDIKDTDAFMKVIRHWSSREAVAWLQLLINRNKEIVKKKTLKTKPSVEVIMSEYKKYKWISYPSLINWVKIEVKPSIKGKSTAWRSLVKGVKWATETKIILFSLLFTAVKRWIVDEIYLLKVVWHEFWHQVYRRWLNLQDRQKWINYCERNKECISKYASSKITEDFAECVWYNLAYISKGIKLPKGKNNSPKVQNKIKYAMKLFNKWLQNI